MFGLFKGDTSKTIDSLGKAIDDTFTSDEERLQAHAMLDKIKLSPLLGQIEINKVEAQHRSIFVAGWRPAVGWICAISLCWCFIGYDLALWIVALTKSNIVVPELTNMKYVLELVLAMLGLSHLRSQDKKNGLTK